MKSVNSNLQNAIRSGYELNAVPRLTVEWNFNRYIQNVSSDNTPSDDSDGFDIEAFPIESIIMPNRPTAGILKARVNEARVSDPYSKYTGMTRAIRSYLGSTEDSYKYWTSPYPTNGLGVFPTNTDGTSKTRPHVLYPGGVKANRIVVGFEDSWVSPKDFTIRVQTTSGGTWTTIATNPTINNKGQVILNFNGTSWSSANNPSENVSSFPTIYGLEAHVLSLKSGAAPQSGTGNNSELSLIEISARRVHDLSNRLVSVDNTFDMADKSFVYPIGTLTSNIANVSFFNEDGAFNSENTDSPYFGLMEPNAKFMLDWVYTVNGTQYTVPEFQMFGGPWMGERSESVSVELTDFSKFFQEIKPRPAAYVDVPVSQVVWRLCDSIGFVDYEIQMDDVTPDALISIWYTDGTKTMWELLDDLAKATQTAIYFDSYGKLQVRTRTNAFNDAATPNWTLRGENAGAELADIIEMSQTDELESNVIKVTYQTTDVDPVVNGISKTQVLWDPDGTVALRAANLYTTLKTTDQWFIIPPADAKVWPYTGMVNIEGEFIKYYGKVFIYYVNGVRKVQVVKSVDEMNLYNAKSTTAERAKNFFDGRFMIEERGVWNTINKQHSVDATGYSARGVLNNRGHYLNLSGFTQNRAQSRVYLDPGPKFKDNQDLFVVTRGSESDPGFYQYGTKIRFEKGAKTQQGGLVIQNQQGNPTPGNDEDGYYIDLIPTSKMTAKMRTKRNEVAFYVRQGGKWKLNHKGGAFNIAEGVEYEIDVYMKVLGNGNHQVQTWINGQIAYTATVTGSDKATFNGKFGMFVRGDTKASYEYLYAINKLTQVDIPDDFSYLDRIAGGNVGGQLDREAVYGWRTITKRVKKKWTKIQDQYMINFFDEFGPIVHEIRQFDIKFEKGPALDSRLYMANDWAAVCPEYSADAWSAKFWLANASRKTTIVNGEDSTGVNTVLSVIGRSVNISDGEQVEVKNDYQIRKRGEIETEITSPWIQSKGMAQQIADWISAHWSNGADEQEVTIFGNPLLEVGDVVAVEYPDMDMTSSTHKYFVVSVKNSFDTGLNTTLTLRRVVT